MKIEDCKVGMRVVIVTGGDKGDIGTISKFTDDPYAVFVMWETGEESGSELWVSTSRIEPLKEHSQEPKFTIAEINEILDEIAEDSDSWDEYEWFATDRTFTAHGLDKVREYFKEKHQKPDLKRQALAKLTLEEIEALGVKL